MYETKRMLLATSATQSSYRGHFRAALLSAQLQLDAFDLLTVQGTTPMFGAAKNRFSQVEVRAAALTAQLAESAHAIPVFADPDTLSPLWREAAGTAAELIVKRARASSADLTVLAPSRRNAFLELLAPSASSDILRQSRNSLLLVHREPQDVYRRVLVAVDFSAESFVAARVALAMAPEARFTFVHAYRLPDEPLMHELELGRAIIGSYLARGCEEARDQLEKWIAGLQPVQACAKAVHSGSPLPVIASCARLIGADLIVVGRQGRSRQGRHGLGVVARRLSASAPCDVLVGPAVAGVPSAHAAAGRLLWQTQGGHQ